MKRKLLIFLSLIFVGLNLNANTIVSSELEVACTSEAECSRLIESHLPSLIAPITGVESDAEVAFLGEYIAIAGIGCVLGLAGGTVSRTIGHMFSEPDYKDGWNSVRNISIGGLATTFSVAVTNPFAGSVLLIGLPATACAEGGEVAVDSIHKNVKKVWAHFKSL